MRVCVLIHEFGRSGGAQTVLRYARRLDGAELLVTGRGEYPADVDGVPVRHVSEAAGERYDCAIATWWATAGFLWDVTAERRLMFLQSIESRFYEEHHFYERMAAEQVLSLPVGYIVVAEWMRELLAELRPDAPCLAVRNGIDKAVFRPPAGPGAEASPAASAASAPPAASAASAPAPLKVLIEGQPTMWFKGVADAVAAVRAMTQPVEATIVAGDPGAGDDIDGIPVVGGFDPEGMAAAYAEHDVVLKLSRVEGLALGPLEAFHVGTPAVMTPFTGYDECLQHGRNGLVVGFDDLPGTARALDSLAADRARLRALSEGALSVAEEWPSADDAATAFARAVEDLAAGPEPDADAALAHLQRAQRRWVELGREHARQDADLARGLRGAVEWHERALAEAAEHHRALERKEAEAGRRELEAQRELEGLAASRAYRTAAALRRLKRGGGG